MWSQLGRGEPHVLYGVIVFAVLRTAVHGCSPRIGLANHSARISRKGQTKECRAYLIANPNFLGDSVPITIKNNRGEGEAELRRRLTDGEYRAYDSIEDFVNPKLGRSVLRPIEVRDD